MQLFLTNRRDPVTVVLTAAAIFIVLFIGFDLIRGLHRYHGTLAATVEKQGPAGVLVASLSAGGLELSGWAPPQASVQVIDHDKPLGTAVTSAEGIWTTTFPYDHHGHNLQILTVTAKKDNKILDVGKLGIFAPDKSYEDAYIWWGGPSMNLLLQAPSGIEDTDMFLAVAWLRPDKGIIFAGNASPGDLVQIYADNEYMGVVPVAGDGTWVTPPLLKPERKTSELRFDDVHKESVVDRRSYHLNWSDTENGWLVDWPSENSNKEAILILKPEAGEASAPDEEKPGQIIPAVNPLHNR